MNINIVKLSTDNMHDVGKPNQGFELIGELVPSFCDGKWTTGEKLYNEPSSKKYDDDKIDLSDYIVKETRDIFLAYDEDNCVGQIRVSRKWNNYCFVEDIAVAKDYRGRGVGGKLIGVAENWAKDRGLFGLMLETQNTNLLACRFYIKQGFILGGVDTQLYSGFDNSEYGLFFYKKI